MAPRVRIITRPRTYVGFPASSQLFTMFMIVGIVASMCVCILARQVPVALGIIAAFFVLGGIFAIVADRRSKRREERYIAEVVGETKFPKKVSERA